MDKYIIKGQKKLKGEIVISGSKNATLPLIAAALLAKGITIIKNVPDLKDIKTMLNVIKELGVQYQFENNKIILDTTRITNHSTPYELVKTMRASVYVLGPLLARVGKAEVSLPGGCAIGPRPVNLHIEAMEKLGAKIEIENGFIKAFTKSLKGTEIFFNKVSVGATANTLMAAVSAQGRTVIKNAALEPEIDELINFLHKMGAKIEGKGTDTLFITGVSKLKPIEHTVISDRIETGTFLVASIITKSPITLKNVVPEHITSLLDILTKIGIKYDIKKDSIKIKEIPRLNPVYIKTSPFPGFATDLHPIIAPLLVTIPGISVINETIFENRFAYIPELVRMGAEIEVDEHIIIIKGGKKLIGANVMASDLRGGAALVLAGLAAKKQTIIDRIYHIDRGYEHFEDKLIFLNADIKRVKE